MRNQSPTRCLTEAASRPLVESRPAYHPSTTARPRAASDIIHDVPWVPARDVLSPSPITPGSIRRTTNAPDIIQRCSNRPALNRVPTDEVAHSHDEMSLSSDSGTNAIADWGLQWMSPTHARFGQHHPNLRSVVPSEASELECPPPHPTPSSPLQENHDGPLPGPVDVHGREISSWLAGLTTVSPAPVKQEAPTLPALQRIKTEKMGVEPGSLKVVQLLNDMANRNFLHDPSNNLSESEANAASPINGRSLSNRLSDSFSEEYSLSANSISSPEITDPRYQTYFASGRSRFLSLTPVHHDTTGFGSGYDGPPSPTRDQGGQDSMESAQPSASSVSKSPQNLRRNKPTYHTTGVIDWEKSWFKHKPRRAHMVSEVTSPDPSVHRHAVDLFSMTSFDSDDSDVGNPEETTTGKQSTNNARVPQERAFQSCPELGRATGADEKHPNSDVAAETGTSGRHPLREALKKPWRFVRRKFGGHSATGHSIRSDLAAHPYGTERRLMSRDSADIYPSSGDESPLFNTPAGTPSEVTSYRESQSEDAEKASTGAAVLGETDLEDCDGLSRPSVSQALLMGKSSSRPTLPRPGHKRRTTTRSRLSEVTTPEDLAPPGMFTQTSSPETGYNSQDSAVVDSQDDEEFDLFAQPARLSRRSSNSTYALWLSPGGVQHRRSPPKSMAEARYLTRTGMGVELRDVMESTLEDEYNTPSISSSSRESPQAKTDDMKAYKPLCSHRVSPQETVETQADPASISNSSPILSIQSALNRRDLVSSDTSGISDASTASTVITRRESCHPDT